MKPLAAESGARVLERIFPASLDAVESFIADMHEHLIACGWKAASFELELMAREALGNAVRHGGKDNPEPSVCVRLVVQHDRAQLCVTDSGSGFDWRNAPTGLPSPASESGRGLCILKSYADAVEFNDTGNIVCVTKVLPHEEV